MNATTRATHDYEWRLGKYIVGQRLGGGMTSVHLGSNNVTNRRIVLKLITESEEDAAAKIRAEERGAEIQKQLAEKDARIPKVFEWGRLEGYFYIEMEHVQGKALDKTGKIGSGLAVTIALEVCEVLELAHKEGIIHGDIKPGNILDVRAEDADKTQRTTIKVLDFGVSRFLTSATRNPFRTIPYCSPEVRMGADPGPIDDLWSLCVTIYELAEGHLPPSEPQKPLFTPESPCPEDLQFILQKMFSPDLRARYQTATELAADLRAFHHGKPLAPAQRPGEANPKTAPAAKENPERPARLATKRVSLRPMLALFVMALIGLVALAVARSANAMLDFARAASAAQPDSPASIASAGDAYQKLDGFGGVPRALMSIAGRSPVRLRETCLEFARGIVAKYARELDLPEKGNVSEREWKAAIDVLAIAARIDSDPEVEAMMAYAKGQYHRINADSRIGISADPERKVKERAAGVDHYAQAEEYFNVALSHHPKWADAQFGLARLYATVFPEMDKAETAMAQAQQWSGIQPLRLQFEMALGHYERAMELNRTVAAALSSLGKQSPGTAADLELQQVRTDLDTLDSHLRSALAYYDSCLSRGQCWDARVRRSRIGSLMVALEMQRTTLYAEEERLRLQVPGVL